MFWKCLGNGKLHARTTFSCCQWSIPCTASHSIVNRTRRFSWSVHSHPTRMNGTTWNASTCTTARNTRSRIARKTNGNMPYNVVFPSQFAHLVIQYQQHPEAKSLAPDGTACGAETNGLLQRAHVIAGEIRYIGKETDRKWEEE